MKTTFKLTPAQSHSSKRFNLMHRTLPPPGRIMLLCLASAALLLQLQSAGAQNAYFQHNLVSDIAGYADRTDTNLVNPWGIAISATSPFWISDNHAGLSTLYNGSGVPLSLVVAIPPPSGGAPPGAPTGIVFNNTTNFAVAPGAGARFIFATEDGTIASWASGNSAVVKADNSASGAVYKGLALGSSGGNNYLYAANFFAGTIDVFFTNYSAGVLAGSFSDPSIPAGFAPFNVQNVGGQLFVTYAKQDNAKHDDVPGPGNGFVNIFDTSGNLIKRFASSNVLDSPWGIAMAPTNFGAFSGALLVGNFGDGQINAFDIATGTSLGSLQDAAGNAIVIPGLWGLVFGNGGSGGDKSTLYFSAGIPGTGAIEDHGLFGSISAIAPTFTGVTNKGLSAAFSWVAGAAPFLLQKKVNLSDSNWVNVLTTSNRNLTLAKESDSGFFRLEGLATNTVLPFTALLSGDAEVPAVSTPATGLAALSLEGSNLTYYISFSGLSSPAIAAHIHATATPTNTAGVVVPFSPPAATAGIISGTVLLTADQVADIVNGMAYVNIHTANNASGEIRGQIVPLNVPITMNGASEVSPVTTSATASGSLTLIGSQLFYSISYSGLTGPATAAHIHGPADTATATGVLIPLATPTGTSGTISGSVSVTPTNLAYLLAGLTYVNIHTTTNTGGEIRGQIWPIQLGATVNAPSAVPLTASPGFGSGFMTILNSVLIYNVTFTNLLSPAILAHIHGPADATHTAGVLIPFSPPAATAGTMFGLATLTSQQLLDLVSGLTYVNIHTTNYPAGEIRGQVIPAD